MSQTHPALHQAPSMGQCAHVHTVEQTTFAADAKMTPIPIRPQHPRRRKSEARHEKQQQQRAVLASGRVAHEGPRAAAACSRQRSATLWAVAQQQNLKAAQWMQRQAGLLARYVHWNVQAYCGTHRCLAYRQQHLHRHRHVDHRQSPKTGASRAHACADGAVHRPQTGDVHAPMPHETPLLHYTRIRAAGLRQETLAPLGQQAMHVAAQGDAR